MRPQLPIPYHLLEAVAEDWGYSVAELRAMANAGTLEIETEMLDGEQRDVIRAEERERIEATYATKAQRPTAALRADARRSYEDVIASLLVMFYGTNHPALMRPYEATNEILQWAARIGLSMTRSTRKYAGILADAGERLRAAGIEPEAAQESPQAAPSDAAPKTGATAPAPKIEPQRAANA